MANFDLFNKKDLKKVVDILRNFGRDRTKYAAEILEEEFEKVIKDLQKNSRYQKKFKNASAKVTIKERKSGKGDAIFIVTVNDSTFFMLDEGTGTQTQYPIHAVDYGLKAFPIRFARSPGYETGNRPMSTPDSLNFSPAVSNVPLDRSRSGRNRNIIFRPVIYHPIQPRHFTEQIIEKVKKRLKDEGVDVTFEVKKQRGK